MNAACGGGEQGRCPIQILHQLRLGGHGEVGAQLHIEGLTALLVIGQGDGLAVAQQLGIGGGGALHIHAEIEAILIAPVVDHPHIDEAQQAELTPDFVHIQPQFGTSQLQPSGKAVFGWDMDGGQRIALGKCCRGIVIGNLHHDIASALNDIEDAKGHSGFQIKIWEPLDGKHRLGHDNKGGALYLYIAHGVAKALQAEHGVRLGGQALINLEVEPQ